MSTTTTTSISAALVARTQTILSLLAFGSAFAIGCRLHYVKIVKNGVAGYPQEWLPSVSATIGDWYPERNIFQLLIALTAAPRFAVLLLTHQVHRSTALLAFGVLRTLLCGGWVYVTSSDDGMVHDVCMIAYIVMNIPWMAGSVLMSRGKGVRRARTALASVFFATIGPLVYFYLQHKVHRIPGAYSSYAIFEWSLIFLDITFDWVAERELREQGIHITIGPHQGPARLTSKLTSGSNRRVHNTDHEVRPEVETSVTQKSTVHEEAVKAWFSFSSPDSISFVSDVYRSYVFWSLFTALIPSLFYYSIWELGIAGAELALLSLLTPAFLNTTPFFLPSKIPNTADADGGSSTTGIPTWFEMLRTKQGQVYAYLVQYVGLVAFLSPSPAVRLAAVTLSVGVGVQREVVLWSGAVEGEGAKGTPRGRRYWSVVSVVAFVGASAVKGVNHGNNPIWPFIDPKNGGWNKTGLGLALAALVEFAFRRPGSSHGPKVDSPAIAKEKDTSVKGKSHFFASLSRPRPSFVKTFVYTSLPLGSLLFTLHNFLADPSTLIAASWTGWENGSPRGPLPHVYYPLTLIVFGSSVAFGILCRGGVRSVMRSPVVPILGLAQALYALQKRDWECWAAWMGVVGVVGASSVAVFEGAARVAVGRAEKVSQISECEDDVHEEGERDVDAGMVARVYAGAMGVYILFNLASIFTVAYAFVPGGWVFRERTGWVVTAQFLFLLPAFSMTASQNASTPRLPDPFTSKTKRRATLILLLFATIPLYFSPLLSHPSSKESIKPYKYDLWKRSGKKLLNAGIWTVHFGFDNEGHDSQRGVRDVVRDMELDVVGLLETDLHRTAFGHRDLTRVLVEELGYYVDIGPGPNSHTWGAVLLSKFPIIHSTHHLLPSPKGELAPAIEAVIDVYGTEVTVVVAHNGQEEDRLDRELQSTELARIMRRERRPVVFLGYVVTKPGAPRPNPYQIMVEDGGVHDIDEDDRDRWCEYIFYRGLYRTSYARVSRGIITDTELQIGQFVVPRERDGEGVGVLDDSRDARYRRSKKEELPVEHWFPMEYYGDESKGGKNGHFYHVFYTPLYYLLPEGAEV
ncbi:Frag1/DRAM/Sfk1 family-domain-containing protein [Ephemerocybe angulata]|uniref:Frag1/DRAM/Sfk1 family-domain-containing protein n=1 Tax=Ephemerocybe angulata TaxID=980116 RepID=A0A8H6I9R7_9AGAR|nr:Frag1/DRAM/Sfk1 family-domain-containing protein [Tulosesus angulatus]